MLAQTRVRRIYKSLTTLFTDFSILMLGAGIIYLGRFRWFENYFTGEKLIHGSTYLQYALLFSLTAVILFALTGMYEISRKRSVFKTILSVSGAISIITLSIIAFLFFNEYNAEVDKVNRSILAIIAPTLIIFVLTGRFLVHLLTKFAYSLKLSQINIIVIGNHSNKFNHSIEKRIDINKKFSFKNLTPFNLKKIENLIVSSKVAEIYIDKSNTVNSSKIAYLAERYKINFIFNPKEIDSYKPFSVQAIRINKELYLELVHTKLDGWSVVAKRTFDFLIALMISLVLSPILLLVAILIKLEDKGPVFYLSERIGPNGKVFLLWKFRRMQQNMCVSESNTNKEALKAEQELIKTSNGRKGGVLYKIHNDPRNTKIGQFIEKYSIDELPQLINVLQGNMSLVGPRPHQPREVSKYKDHHYKVLNIKPGITGMAQISGRSDLKFDDEVKLDTYYLENWSLSMDILIIIKTPITILFNRHNS